MVCSVQVLKKSWGGTGSMTPTSVVWEELAGMGRYCDSRELVRMGRYRDNKELVRMGRYRNNKELAIMGRYRNNKELAGMREMRSNGCKYVYNHDVIQKAMMMR